MQETMCDISLIVVNYNGAELLPRCIESALATVPAGAEVIVVDNASTDRSRQVLERYAGHIKAVLLPRNIGFGSACNLGVAAARGDTLIFLNPDVEFPAGWLEPLLDVIWGDPRIGFACPDMLVPGTPLPQPVGEPIEDRAMLPGCGLTARRDTWYAIGGFDGHFFLYWEDTELCWRAWLLGFRVVLARHSYVFHERSVTTAASGRWDGERIKNSLYTYLKLMRWRQVMPFALLLAVKTLIKMVRQRDPALLAAWRWNGDNLRGTLKRRRELRRRQSGDIVGLERLLALQERQFEAERRARQRIQGHTST